MHATSCLLCDDCNSLQRKARWSSCEPNCQEQGIWKHLGQASCWMDSIAATGLPHQDQLVLLSCDEEACAGSCVHNAPWMMQAAAVEFQTTQVTRLKRLGARSADLQRAQSLLDKMQVSAPIPININLLPCQNPETSQFKGTSQLDWAIVQL